ncbi:CPBP family intramembrane metalloprotease [Phormidium tenue FACHB-886]|nr:CPBP family intramembrane metalloprotease [Phormidium tenue FACHB-886]
MARVLGRRRSRRRNSSSMLLVLLALIISVLMLCRPAEPPPAQVSRYAIAQESLFNHPDYYPLQQVINRQRYQPVAPWLGRLILPTQKEKNAPDWVWFEVYNSPPESQALIGKMVRLEWKKEVQPIVQSVTRDVKFTPEAIESQKAGNVHPSRLNSRSKVGPLQSLAGGRPEDDVVVALGTVSLETAANAPVLRITTEPTQVTGRFYGLVKILGSVSQGKDIPKACPGDSPCLSEEYQVIHYNSTSKKFDGIQEVIRIPQVLPSFDQLFQSTPKDIENSAVGIDGWYIYGARNKNGIFVVQALQPRSLLRLKPDQVLLGKSAGRHYIHHRQWQEITKGTLKTVLIDPGVTQSKQALANWKEGDRALLVHLFGGIGGNKAEQNPIPGTVTGHFAYGLAEVVRDRFTQELQFKIRYFQVYSHNPDGIVSGVNSWANYMGNLQLGWLGTRPVADVLVKWDALTQDYDFGGVRLSPLWELQQQLGQMMARYRIGNGTGAALVTPALSCVQDSSQAVYRTIKTIEAQVRDRPAIQAWLKAHPTDPQTKRFQELAQFSKALEQSLLPLGIVRPDWQKNADRLAGIRGEFVRQNDWIAQLLSWRTVLPKVAHDQVISLFLDQGAALWVLRTNQVGGWDADIQPLSPTELFGQFFIIPNSFSRLIEALKLPSVSEWLITIALLVLYGLIATPIGFQQQFLHLTVPFAGMSRWQAIGAALRLLWMPALVEELIFRVLLIPHPTEGANGLTMSVWAIVSWISFVLYHPLNAMTFYRPGYPTFFRLPFLSLMGLLGIFCTAAYMLTGSLWAIGFIHWIVVLVWLQLFGGLQTLGLKQERQG